MESRSLPENRLCCNDQLLLATMLSTWTFGPSHDVDGMLNKIQWLEMWYKSQRTLNVDTNGLDIRAQCVHCMAYVATVCCHTHVQALARKHLPTEGVVSSPRSLRQMDAAHCSNILTMMLEDSVPHISEALDRHQPLRRSQLQEVRS